MRRGGESPLTQTQRTHRARLKRHAQGICWFCVEPIAPGSSGMCVEHLTRNRARKRTTQATGTWQPGGCRSSAAVEQAETGACGMSLVTLVDKARALQMVGLGSASHDRLLLSLAQQTTWTHNQRSLVDRMWREQQSNREAAMHKKAVLCVGVVMTFALMAGCAATYTKITAGPNGKAVEELTYEPKWWANLDRPDWMDVIERHSYVPGQAPVHETCDVEPTHPTVLRCERQ